MEWTLFLPKNQHYKMGLGHIVSIRSTLIVMKSKTQDWIFESSRASNTTKCKIKNEESIFLKRGDLIWKR